MSTLSIPPNTFSAPPNTITLHSANKEVIRITHDGRLVTGEGLSADEATQEAAKLLIASFEAEIKKMVEKRIAAELDQLRADNLTAHQMACAAGLERDQLRAEVSEARRAWLGDDYGHLPLIEALEKFRSDSDAQSDRADVLYQRSCEVEHALRAEVERLNALGSWAHTCIHHTDAERKAWVACPCCANARAAHAEAALAEWSVLNLWGGTPEIIHEFIKGQQNRIHHCQDLETELAHLRAAIDAAMKGTP